MIFLNELRANEKLAKLAAAPATAPPRSFNPLAPAPAPAAAPRLPLPVFRARTH